MFLSSQLFGPPLWCGKGMDGWEDLLKTLLARHNENVAKVQYLAFEGVDCAMLFRRIGPIRTDKCFSSLKRAISIIFDWDACNMKLEDSMVGLYHGPYERYLASKFYPLVAQWKNELGIDFAEGVLMKGSANGNCPELC